MMKKYEAIEALANGAYIVIDDIYCVARLYDDDGEHVVRYDVAKRLAADTDRYIAEHRDGWIFTIYVTDRAYPESYDVYGCVVETEYYSDIVGVITDVVVKEFNSENELFCYVSKIICFSDCDPREVTKIVCHGRECEYVGWRPCMEFTYIYKDTGAEAWTGYFDHWDH